MSPKKTVIIGASTNPERYSFIAANRLAQYQHEIVLISNKKGQVLGQNILPYGTGIPDVDTITLYLGARHQPAYYDYFLSLKPKRIIFNPGTENPELEELAKKHKIHTEIACTRFIKYKCVLG